jgi:hypothetical protein
MLWLDMARWRKTVITSAARTVKIPGIIHANFKEINH